MLKEVTAAIQKDATPHQEQKFKALNEVLQLNREVLAANRWRSYKMFKQVCLNYRRVARLQKGSETSPEIIKEDLKDIDLNPKVMNKIINSQNSQECLELAHVALKKQIAEHLAPNYQYAAMHRYLLRHEFDWIPTD